MLSAVAAALGIAPDWSAIVARLMTKQGKLRKRVSHKEGFDDPDFRRGVNQWLETLHARGLASLLSLFMQLPPAPAPAVEALTRAELMVIFGA